MMMMVVVVVVVAKVAVFKLSPRLGVIVGFVHCVELVQSQPRRQGGGRGPCLRGRGLERFRVLEERSQ